MDFSYVPPKKSARPKSADKPEKAQAGRDEAIAGVFSTQSVARMGTGASQRRTIQKTYWFAKQTGPKTIEVQPLNRSSVPAGPKREVPLDEFLEKFAPEPEFYVSTVYPKMQELQKTVVRGEKHRAHGELYAAEFEFGHALKVDEENVRANFGLGLTYMDRGEKNKANDIFERLVKLDATFDTQHKHLFNDFGISLRKNQMYDQALAYYRRAVELTQDDENLWMNLARACYEKGDIAQCVEHLRKAIEINPGLDEARQFWEFLVRKEHVRDAYPGKAQPKRAVSETSDRADADTPSGT